MAERRSRLIVAMVAAAAGGVLVVLAVFLLSGIFPGGSSSPVDQAGSARSAREACRTVRLFLELVRTDAAAHRVLDLLDSAVNAATAAADRDPAWRPLAGGVQAVRLALDEDDPEAARVGLAVVAANCERAGVPIDRAPVRFPSG